MRAAADEARKRRAEEIEQQREAELAVARAQQEAAKKRAEEEAAKARDAALKAPTPPPPRPPPAPPPPPSASKRRAGERSNRAQRRAEMKARAEGARTVTVRVVRVTTEVTTVAVPITDAVTRGDSSARDDNGPRSRPVDPEKLFAEATKIAARPGTRWQREGEPRVLPHAEQPPLFDTSDLIRRS
jgi:hypothetical protein